MEMSSTSVLDLYLFFNDQLILFLLSLDSSENLLESSDFKCFPTCQPSICNHVAHTVTLVANVHIVHCHTLCCQIHVVLSVVLIHNED